VFDSTQEEEGEALDDSILSIKKTEFVVDHY
jgi:hypothetical protein